MCISICIPRGSELKLSPNPVLPRGGIVPATQLFCWPVAVPYYLRTLLLSTDVLGRTWPARRLPAACR